MRVASETVILCVAREIGSTDPVDFKLSQNIVNFWGVASSNTWTLPQTSKIQERAQSRFQPKSEDIGPENEVGKSRW